MTGMDAADRIPLLERELLRIHNELTAARADRASAVEEQLNSLLMDTWDLASANAPIGAGDCREIAKVIGARVAEIRRIIHGRD